MRKIICVDVDGTLADYSSGWQGLEQIGEPIPGAVAFTKELHKFADVVIYTTRCCEDMNRGLTAHFLRKLVQEWLDKHGFAYDDIYIGQGKPICNAFIDDRAIHCAPQVLAERMALNNIPVATSCKNAYADAIWQAQRLCDIRTPLPYLEQDKGEKEVAARNPTPVYETSTL